VQVVAFAEVVLGLEDFLSLEDEFPLLVLLACLKGLVIFPADDHHATVAVDVAHGVKAGSHEALLLGARPHIDAGVEKVRLPMARMELLGDDLGGVGQMRVAISAAVEVPTQLFVKYASHGWLVRDGNSSADGELSWAALYLYGPRQIPLPEMRKLRRPKARFFFVIKRRRGTRTLACAVSSARVLPWS